jgi:hypothetical protein
MRDVSRSTRFARSGQAFDVAALPPLIGCNSEGFREQAVTLPLDMTELLFDKESGHFEANVQHSLSFRPKWRNLSLVCGGRELTPAR